MKRKNIQSFIGLLIPFVLSLIAYFLPLLETYRAFIILIFFFTTLIYFSIYLHFEKRTDLQEIQTESISLIVEKDFDLEEAVKKAKHSVFISGGTLSGLCNHRDLLINLPSRIKLELVLLDIEDDELLKRFCAMVEGPNTPEKMRTQYEYFLILVDELKNRKNTYIHCVDFITPIKYVGIDIDIAESSSRIKSRHYIRNIHGGEGSIRFEVKAGTELFRIYKKQIDLLREHSKKVLLPAKNE